MYILEYNANSVTKVFKSLAYVLRILCVGYLVGSLLSSSIFHGGTEGEVRVLPIKYLRVGHSVKLFLVEQEEKIWRLQYSVGVHRRFAAALAPM